MRQGSLILLVAKGSYGDVLPFIGLARELRQRGHGVMLFSNDAFAGLAKQHGIPFQALSTKEEYQALVREADVRRPFKAASMLVSHMMLSPMRNSFRLMEKEWQPGHTVIVSHILGLGPRLLAEKYKIPFVSLLLSPALVRSYHSPPRLAPIPLSKLMYRAAISAGEAYMEWSCRKLLNGFRSELALAPLRGVWPWLSSPDRILGMWPEWFAPPAPDWDARIRLAGFPLYDGQGRSVLNDGVVRFLEAGPAPIVFTPGTPQSHGDHFFLAALQAMRIMGRRAIFLTPHRHHLPADLPQNIFHVDYVPFGQLLDSAAVFVHHGGIGTSAHALRAGVPQLVLPWGVDQYDNAARLKQLGVAEVGRFRTVSAKSLVRQINILLNKKSLPQQCRHFAKQLQSNDPLDLACREIEALLS